MPFCHVHLLTLSHHPFMPPTPPHSSVYPISKPTSCQHSLPSALILIVLSDVTSFFLFTSTWGSGRECLALQSWVTSPLGKSKEEEGDEEQVLSWVAQQSLVMVAMGGTRDERRISAPAGRDGICYTFVCNHLEHIRSKHD